MTSADLLAAVREALKTAPITEAYIHDPHYVIDGLCDQSSGRITVSPAPGVVETLCHELLHYLYPRWSEGRVDREAKRLLGRMSDAQVRDFYRIYQRRKRSRKTPVQTEP